MPKLDEAPTLKTFQSYVSELEVERGFSHQTTIEKCLLLGEEVGELFKAVRKREGLAIDQRSESHEVGSELVDVFIYLCAIANRLGLDLEAEFRHKEAINERRVWD